jgi:hypothetical protein
MGAQPGNDDAPPMRTTRQAPTPGAADALAAFEDDVAGAGHASSGGLWSGGLEEYIDV